MTGKNCPFCGAEIEPGKARDKAVCPSCGREFDYNTLNAEARGIIDGKRWAREDEERKGAVAIRRKRTAAAASLDVENETLIQTAISRLIKDKTVLVIAHRMRTVAGADKIVVFSDGVVAEQGSPDELYTLGGVYAHMVDLQTAGNKWQIK